MNPTPRFSINRFRWHVFIVLVSLVLTPRQADAAECGMGRYIQGAYGDFFMGYIPAAGFYVRNDTLHQAARIDGTLKGRLVCPSSGMSQKSRCPS